MGDSSRLELVIDSKGVVTANGNLDLFKKKADEAAKAGTNLENSAKDFGSQLHQSLFGSMTAANLAADAIRKTAKAGVELVQSSLQASGQLEMIHANLVTVMGSASAADETFRELKDFAARTPFEMPGITESAIMLKQSGVAAGDLIGTLQTLGDAAGGSQEKLNRIALNYAQIMSVGKASTMDIKQFAMAGLPIYSELSKVLGVTNEQLGEMIGNGEASRDVIVKAFKSMTAEGGAFFKGMERGAETLDGKISTLEDSWRSFQASLADSSGLSQATKDLATSITDILDKITEANQKLIETKIAIDIATSNGALTTQQNILLLEKQLKNLDEIQNTTSNVLKMAGINPIISKTIGNLAGLDDKRAEIRAQIAEYEKQGAIDNKIAEYRKQNADKIAEANKKQSTSAAEWQEVLKKTLDLDEVTTGRKAVDDYQKSLEDSLEGAIVYAQLTGGNIAKVYTDYAKDVDEAVKTLLLSGQFSVNDNAIQGLLRLKKELAGEASDRTGLTGYQFGQSQNPQFMLDDQKKQGSFNLAPLGDATGFNFKLSEDFGITDDTINEQEERAKRLQDIFRQLGEDLKKFAADSTFTALWDMGEALYAGEDAAKAFGKSLLRSILNNVPAMLFQAGFQLAITGNVYGGLALMAASGLAGVAGGYLTSMMDDGGERQSEADKLQIIANQLRDLITEARAESIYYQDMLQTKMAQYENSTISHQSVNDAIIAPGGKIITTAPDDYLYASKDPSKFGGGSTVVQVSVVNEAGDVAVASATQRKLADGTTEILVGIKRMIASDIASGDLDSAFEARETRLAGRRVGV